MNSYRRTAIVVGALFILSTLTCVLSVYVYGDILESADFLTDYLRNENRIIFGTMLELICAGAFVGVSISIFPVLSFFGKRYAIGYLIGRSFEAVPFIISIISTLSLLTLSQQVVQAGSINPNLYLVSGAVLQALRHWANLFGPLIFCGFAALPFYYVLWQSSLVPRFLSMWGLIGTVLYLIAGFLGFWGITTASSVLPVILIVPFAVNEMVLAVWFIVKGFNLSRVPSSTAT